MLASIAFSPIGASPAWAGRPLTTTWNHNTPTCEVWIVRLVGSVTITASAGRPASTH